MEQQDWDKLNALRLELNNNLIGAGCDTQEKFAELFVKSIQGKGNSSHWAVSRTSEGGLPPFAGGENEL